MKKILVVDDEANYLKVISASLGNDRYSVETARTGEEALEKFNGGSYDLVLTDIKMPGMDGETLLGKIREAKPSLPVILMTGYGTIESAVDAMKKGAYTYLTKPVRLDVLTMVLDEVLGVDLDEEREKNYDLKKIIGKSRAIMDVISMIQRVSKTDANVLVLGESGTGKELIARAIHYTSLKANGPFIPVDCTTIPVHLMESELFGHEKGAFTGAMGRKTGLLEMANGGTVFFDEIGDLDYALQKKLLRFLQEKELKRVGGKKKIEVDARVLAATNMNIEEAVNKGSFRADLYYRLNVITINVPPLRARKEDIPLLAQHFLKIFSEKNKKDLRGFDDEVFSLFNACDWAGNVRELENVIERAVIMCPYDRIVAECLPRRLRLLAGEESPPGNDFNLPEMERKIIIKALNSTAGNQSSAARLLGISRKTLRTKMKNHGLLSSCDE